MPIPRCSFILALLGLLLAGIFVHPSGTRAAQSCFAETGQCLGGRFLDYWQANGGLARNGFPLTGERRETLEDGREYTVQYFERARFESHPEYAAPYDVLLGQFGRRVLRERFREDVGGYQRAVAPVAPLADQSHFAETGHNLGGRFLDYWRANGGLAQFGYPLTEEFDEFGLAEPGTGYRVQYFERARLEYHPEHANTPYEVLLGQFGRAILEQADRLSGSFGYLYLTDEEVRGRLGRPLAPALRVPGAAQSFERGRMIWRGDLRGIYVLCGGEVAGQLLVAGRYGERQTPYFPDTWAEGQEPGGGDAVGAAPTPGLYEPQRGFGKVWREGVMYYTDTRVRDCLGYATTPKETGYELVVQEFERGVMLASPDGRAIDVVATRWSKNFGLAGSYTRYPAQAR